MGGGADDLDAALAGGVIGPGPGERGQERVVNVDDAAGKGLHEGGAENLHVARQDDEVRSGFAEQFDLAGLDGRFIVRRDGDVVERNAVAFGQPAVIGMVGQDQGDVDGPFAAFMTGENVVKAVPLPGDHHGHAQAGVGQPQAPLDAARTGHGLELFVEPAERQAEPFEFPFHAREEHALGRVDVLIQGDDVAVVLGDEGGQGGDDPALVGAGNQQNGGGAGCHARWGGQSFSGISGGRREAGSGAASGGRSSEANTATSGR